MGQRRKRAIDAPAGQWVSRTQWENVALEVRSPESQQAGHGQTSGHVWPKRGETRRNQPKVGIRQKPRYWREIGVRRSPAKPPKRTWSSTRDNRDPRTCGVLTGCPHPYGLWTNPSCPSGRDGVRGQGRVSPTWRRRPHRTVRPSLFVLHDGLISAVGTGVTRLHMRSAGGRMW